VFVLIQFDFLRFRRKSSLIFNFPFSTFNLSRAAGAFHVAKQHFTRREADFTATKSQFHCAKGARGFL